MLSKNSTTLLINVQQYFFADNVFILNPKLQYQIELFLPKYQLTLIYLVLL